MEVLGRFCHNHDHSKLALLHVPVQHTSFLSQLEVCGGSLRKRLPMFCSLPNPISSKTWYSATFPPLPQIICLFQALQQMQPGTRKGACQEGSVQPKAGKSSSALSTSKQVRKLRFDFPAAPEQSVAASRNCFAASSQKRQRSWKSLLSQLRFSSQFVYNYHFISNTSCHTSPGEQHHRRARRRDVPLMLCIKHSDLAENQRKERRVQR